MKLLHTADWHLGQTFHGQERHVEHQAFLDWLLATLEERHSDALLIAGDIFDVVNPSLRAQQQLYDFIVSAHQRLPRLRIVLIAGNHDSGARIELPGPLLERLRTHALGRVIWLDDGQGEAARLAAERLLIPLEAADGQIAAWCLALPFLRPAEVDRLCGDASKARKELEWEPSVDFEELVKLMVESDMEMLENG